MNLNGESAVDKGLLTGDKKGVPDERPGTPASMQWKLDEFAHEDEADDQREEGEAFDECGGDDHVGADGAFGFGLTGDGFDGAAADVADAAGRAGDTDAGTDHDACGTDADAEVAQMGCRIDNRLSGLSENVQH